MRATSKNKTLQWVGIGCIAVLVVTCICAGIVTDTFSSLGELITAPFRWLRGVGTSVTELSLAEAVERGETAQFALDSGCEYLNARGTSLSSQPDVDQGQDFSEELAAETIEDLATEALSGMTFSLANGQATLANGEPVQLEDRPDGLYLSVEQDASDGGTLRTNSLQGTVQGDIFSGSLYLSGYTSTVISGEGVEREITAQVDLTCPVKLREP